MDPICLHCGKPFSQHVAILDGPVPKDAAAFEAEFAGEHWTGIYCPGVRRLLVSA